MAKPLTQTPVIKGKDAEVIRQEIVRGTPNSPERIKMIHSADAIFRAVQQRRVAKG